MLDGGMIMHLTLHGFEFAVGEKKSEVAIGQNLQGETVAPPVLPNPTAVAATPPAGQKDAAAAEPAPAPSDAIPAAAMVEGGPANVVIVPSGPSGNEGVSKRRHRPTDN